MAALAFPELVRVRFWSWAAACGVLCAALMLLMQRSPSYEASGFNGLAAINVSVEEFSRTSHADELPPPVRADPTHANAVRMEAAAASANEGEALRLWRDGANGEILFHNPGQYQRCVEARRAARDAADCPSPHESRPLVFEDVQLAPAITIELQPLQQRWRRQNS